MRLRPATAADAAGIRALLVGAALPTEDLESAEPYFVVACGSDEDLIGTGALQHCGSSALVRSVAVAPQVRGTGLGRAIVEELERVARSTQVERLILLTLGAQDFFAKLGYRVVERNTVPKDVQGSAEFRSLCPASAICMMKILKPS